MCRSGIASVLPVTGRFSAPMSSFLLLLAGAITENLNIIKAPILEGIKSITIKGTAIWPIFQHIPSPLVAYRHMFCLCTALLKGAILHCL